MVNLSAEAERSMALAEPVGALLAGAREVLEKWGVFKMGGVIGRPQGTPLQEVERDRVS